MESGSLSLADCLSGVFSRRSRCYLSHGTLKANVIIAILIVLGIFGHVQAYRERPATAICGTDFPIFYAGAKLLGTGDLYSPAAVQRI